MNVKIINFLLLITIASSTLTIKCNFEKISSYYSCNPVGVVGVFNKEKQDDILVNGSHLSGFNDDDVTYVRFNSPMTFNYVPTKLFETFSNIQIFGLHSVNLTLLSSKAFKNCFKLNSLHVDGNENLTMVASSFAEECNNIKNIYMPCNGLKSLDTDAFKGLENLSYLVLSKNQLTNLPATIFTHTPNLEFLFLDHNQIVSLHADLLCPMRKLQLLSATFNHIELISLDVFQNKPLLDQIFLDNNQIDAIEQEFFDEFLGKREFYEFRFYNNNCTTSAVIASKTPQENKHFDEEKFSLCFANWYDLHRVEVGVSTEEIDQLSSTMDIEVISFEHNCRFFLNENKKYSCVLENVELVIASVGGDHLDDFSDLNVTQLFFINSVLSRVPSAIFKKFPNLEFLSVANTQIPIINEQTFSDCNKLKKIDASENQITKIVETSLKNCKVLEVIDVSDNPIEAVDGEIFHYDPQLKHIILHRNY